MVFICGKSMNGRLVDDALLYILFLIKILPSILNYKLLKCQPEPVEGGFLITPRLRQAQPDTSIETNFIIQ